jgi:hypothetical protein
MGRTRRVIAGVVLGLVALAVVAGIAIASFSNTASAAPADQTTPTPAANQNATNKGQYREAFKQAFAAKLGVDEAKLDAAFTGAVDDTLDQAVKDGTITQAQADKIKQTAQNGFQGGPFAGKNGKRGEAIKKLGSSLVDDAAKAIGITTDDLKTELKAGKSIADVASEHKVDVATVKTAMFNGLKADLDAKVKAGTITQAQADKISQAATTRIDNLVNRKK